MYRIRFALPERHPRVARVFRALLSGLCLTSSVVWAQTAGIDTLARIRQTQTVIIGNREAARPFSYLNEQQQPTGYSIDLCLKVVDKLRRDLKLPNLRVQYLTLSGAERIPKVKSGAVDMECGSTTNTKARQEQVDFSYTIFVAGMKILARTDSGITDLRAIGSRAIALSKGTTSEKLFTQMREQEMRELNLQHFASNTDAIKALEAGKVSFFPQDDVLLSGLAATLPNHERYTLIGDYLSIEPYAIMVRKGDAEFLSVIDKTLAELYGSGEIRQIYDRWFNTATLKIPMSMMTKEAFTRPGKDSGFAKVLGYTL